MDGNVVLVGNPNSGKSSLFNKLTGLQQKIGNYPGVTVERKKGKAKLPNGTTIQITDLPGAYSLFPTTDDEKIATREVLKGSIHNEDNLLVYVADITKLEKHLLFFSQLYSLGKKMILCLNMADQVKIRLDKLETFFQTEFEIPVVSISAKRGLGIDELKKAIQSYSQKPPNKKIFFSKEDILEEDRDATEVLMKGDTKIDNDYLAFVLANHAHWLSELIPGGQKTADVIKNSPFNPLKAQVQDTMKRFSILEPMLLKITPLIKNNPTFTDRLDRLLTHRVMGPAIFVILMLFIFQAIFAWAQIPMEWIDGAFGSLNGWISDNFESSWFTALLTEGILAGIGGVVIFIPQIAILFFLIGILEETGYMSRIVFMLDNSMQKVGMNGRSVVALVSGGACAIPAIMSTRNIAGWKERLITIMVTPLISCSARIPVYALLIAMVVPYKKVGGIFNLQGLSFALLYFLGAAMAIIIGFILSKWIKSKSPSFLMMEMPDYRTPNFRNVTITTYNKVKSFIVEAGKIIFVISIALWFMASYGPKNAMKEAEENAVKIALEENLSPEDTENLIATNKLENSFAGIMGKAIEPVIRPIGFDWKIGISLITSFAAREVFVGTMATIYSVGSEDNTEGIQAKMENATFADTGKKVYTPATIWSLLLFYAFAMQCMSTLAVVKKETGTWKWPIIQFVYLTLLAYFSSLIIYNILS
ncbi:ferrous iron transport protein B [Membranihabitans maritimus]|uniref:ferrous iron transport protein B n=1 Tax=Membranihabitans maritimus TaxID=2904244 RepID=UPI001F000576|nr:ferrous iron transport protein B [Membranihabitans maritimus]